MYILEFQNILYEIKKMHKLCNEDFLPWNYQKIIDDFRQEWYNLTDAFEVSTIPKIHILLHHVEEYFDLTNATLKRTTDELCERIHQDLNKRLLRSMYYGKDVKNPKQGSILYQGIHNFNTYNFLCALVEK